MHKFTIMIVGLLFTSSCWSCSSKGDEVKDTENEVFAIHDEVMPKMGNMLKLQKQLKLHIASLDSIKATGTASGTLRIDEDRDQAMRLSRNLKVADSLMMNWMSRYNGDTLAKLSSDEALKYLGAQKDQITDVQTKVNASIEQATQFLGKK
ncbi:viral A-type inclusion protein [Spirosoma validum]|uniref:Viral A-type inclusion protein n=1 Tax=Spirosoma validum TaxID=2771355 RepID=A0A927B4T7_9BACT|nr:viral A-type inclusion protein [Spirosoma validum]MBD2755399.1 viral A-type inclusion protein [Spirosoma validum]